MEIVINGKHTIRYFGKNAVSPSSLKGLVLYSWYSLYSTAAKQKSLKSQKAMKTNLYNSLSFNVFPID